MNLTGNNWIGFAPSKMGETFQSMNPATDEALPTLFHESTSDEINAACQKAGKAFSLYKNLSGKRRASFLKRIAELIEADNSILEIGNLETALPEGRLRGERARTVGQLRMFAAIIEEGSWVDAKIDLAQPDRQPRPKLDIRSMLVPLGPVAVFGASNFPLAYSVAGGDTASALAAGCPVVVKGHPSHPGTSECVANAIIKAAKEHNLPDGVFSLLHGKTHRVGQALVGHTAIQAVGFTGSYRGGKALFDAANKRDVPIPVFAEMGSTNPVFVLPEAMASSTQDIATTYVNSLTLGVGQFCTNPGLLFTNTTMEGVETFTNAVEQSIAEVTAKAMLNSGIHAAFENGIQRLNESSEMKLVGSGKLGDGPNQAQAVSLMTLYNDFKKHPDWADEIFGPSSIIIQTGSKDDFLDAAKQLEGHLTASVFGTDSELLEYQDLIELLAVKVGRLIINGFPTGVEVCSSMVHGGPFPATTAPQTTAVGSAAIKRFVRPLCYQNFPQTILPDALKNSNPLDIMRTIDDVLTNRSIE